MDVLSVQRLAEELIARHGLARRGWLFALNRRKRTLGLCRYDVKRIELSQYFVIYNDQAAIRDTLLHEIAHAIAGHKAGHGAKWVSVCHRLGAIPNRICTTAAMPRGAFLARCQSCGYQHSRHRRPIKGRTYYCLVCGVERGRLRFSREGTLRIAIN